jgi:hypothetical protein
MWTHSLTFHLGIHEGDITIVGFHLCHYMMEWHMQVQFHLNNSQEANIVTIAFHLRQCMVEWHESHSI